MKFNVILLLATFVAVFFTVLGVLFMLHAITEAGGLQAIFNCLWYGKEYC